MRGHPCHAVLLSAILLTSLSASLPGRSAAFGGDTGRDVAMLDEYKNAIAALKSAYAQVEAEGTLTDVIRGKGGYHRTKERGIRFLRNGTSEIIRIAHRPASASEKSEESVIVRNPQHWFKLKRAEEGAPFTVNTIGEAEKAPEQEIRLYRRGFLDAAYSVHGLSIEEMLNSPGFRLKGIEDLSGEGRHLVRFSFEYRRPDKGDPLSGWWTVDPSEGWALREFQAKVGAKGSMQSTVQYRGKIGDAPRPERISIEYRFGDYGQSHTFTFDRYEPRAAGDREFTLSAFGIDGLDAPAVSGGPDQATLLFGAAGVLLVGAVTLRFVGHHLRGAPAGPE